MKNITKNIISTILIFALVVGCFAAIPIANAAPKPVEGNPGWKAEYSKSANMGKPVGLLWDRGNAAGDKITSNAHSADWEGVYFYWDDKQKDDGVLLVCDWVFDLFTTSYKHAGTGISFDCNDPGFVLTAKNSNNYWGYKIARSTGKVIDKIDGVDIYAFAIPKQMQYINTKNGKTETDSLKNINMVFIDGQYKSAWVLIMKAWFNEDGKLIWKPFDVCDLNSKLSFSNGLKLGLNKDDFGEIKITDFKTAKDGKTITITETAKPDGYAFKSACVIYGNEQPTNVQGVSLKLKPGDKAAVLFENQKQWAEITIVKKWIDYKELCIDAPEGGARFDIQGITSYENVIPGTYLVKEGTYKIIERDIDGFELVAVCGADSSDLDAQSATIAVAAGGKYTVKFINQDPTTPPTYKNSIVKKVDGRLFFEWFTDYEGDKKADLIEDMSFYLYRADDIKSPFVRFTNDAMEGRVGDDSLIHFYPNIFVRTVEFDLKTLPDGYYMITEELGNVAKQVFDDPAEAIYFYVYNGVISKERFDYDDSYTIVNGYGGGYTLGYPGLNNAGDIFYIGVTSTTTGYTFDSFCAKAGSVSFFEGPGNYMVALRTALTDEQRAAFIKAYNYIQDTYGDLNDYRPVTQIVTWCLLGDIDCSSAAFDNINWAAVTAGSSNVKGVENAKAIVEDVIANYADHSGKGQIIDVVYMVGKDNRDYVSAQPQLVPIYAPVINNKVKDTVDVSFYKTKYGVEMAKNGLEPLPVADDEFGFELFKIVDDVKVSQGIFYTIGGKVTATGLGSGSYVFQEVWTTVFDGGLGYDADGNPVENYNLVWKAIYPNNADGLYFTIADNGKIDWRDYDGDDLPTVDNEIFGKHNVLWAPDGYDPEALTLPHHKVIELDPGYGKIIYITDSELTMTIVEIVYPTCAERGIIWIGCSDGTGTSIKFGELCEHDCVYLGLVVDGIHNGYLWYGGQNGCTCGGMMSIDKWIELGYEFPPPE